MQQDLTETLAKLANRNLSSEEAAALLASLEGKDLRLEMQFQRHSATFAMNAPDAYRGGQTLNGKAGQHEVQVLVPEKDEKAVRALSYGTPLSLVVRYLEFDDFYRRVTFTGDLPDEPEKPETAPTEPAVDDSPEPEPDPVTEDEPPSVESTPKDAGQKVGETWKSPAAEEKPPAKPEPPTPKRTKPRTGELAVFASPDLPVASGASIAGKSSVRSSEIIANLARQTQTSEKEAALVVDGFWDYLANVKGHFRKHTRAHTLVIPHFGSFRFKYRRGTKRILDFMPAPENWKSRGIPSSSWVDQWSGQPQGLSVRRRISVFVAEQSGLPLKKADTMLSQLLETVKVLSRKKVTINWARRGTMRGGKTKTGKEFYSFFASEGFLDRLQVPTKPAPTRWSAPQHKAPAASYESPDDEYETDHEYDSPKPRRQRSSAAKKWSILDPEGYKENKPPMPMGQKVTMRASGCGCLALPFVGVAMGSGSGIKAGILLGLLFFILLVKRALCHKG